MFSPVILMSPHSIGSHARQTGNHLGLIDDRPAEWNHTIVYDASGLIDWSTFPVDPACGVSFNIFMTKSGKAPDTLCEKQSM